MYTRRGPREFVLRTVSHNVQSLRQKEAIELVIEYMRSRKVDAYCMQETWKGGTGVYCNKGFTIIYVNEDGVCRGGVGIVLSPAATRAWDATGTLQGGAALQTNNRGELSAILIALEILAEEIAEGDRPVVIGTDSAYSIQMAGDCGRKARARGWKSSRRKKLKNVDLIKILLDWRAAYGDWFRFVHIYSHTGKKDPRSIGNHGADRLAVRAAKMSRSERASSVSVDIQGPKSSRR